MSRRLLLEEEVGSTSSRCSDKPVAEIDEARISSQQSNTVKVKNHEPHEPIRPVDQTLEPLVIPVIFCKTPTRTYPLV